MLGSGSNYRREIAPQNPARATSTSWSWRAAQDRPQPRHLAAAWHAFEYTVYPQVGAIEADGFDPARWKPEYPNPAFERMLPEDAFWAARIVSKVPDAAIRAIVALADLRAPEAEAHLVRMILARRTSAGAVLHGPPTPREFRIEATASGPQLALTHHGEDAGLARLGGYEVQWFAFDNDTEAESPLGEATRVAGRAVPLPDERSSS